MTTAFSSASFHWLTDPEAPAFQMDDTANVIRMDIPMPAAIGHGWVENYHLTLGMNLSRGIHHFTAAMAGGMVPFANITAELPENTLSVQSAQHGRVLLHERRAAVELWFGDGSDLFHHIDRLDMIPHLDASSMVAVTMLKIGEPVLFQLLGEAAGQALFTHLGIDAVPSARVWPVPSPVAALLHASLTSSLSGSMRTLFAQAKVLEYLCSLAQHAHMNLQENAPMTRRRQQVQALHEELTRLEGKLPTLDELALRYGLSARTLDNDFKQAFGQSIFAFVTGHQLAQAHDLLRESNVPMKQLAARLGYSHVNHFITAFRRRYGYTPGSARLGLPSAPSVDDSRIL